MSDTSETKIVIPEDLREQYEICLLGRENAEKVGVLPLIERVAKAEAALVEMEQTKNRWMQRANDLEMRVRSKERQEACVAELSKFIPTQP